MQHPTTAFIGAGNMAKAIIAGLIENGYPADKIIASNRNTEKLQQLASQFAIKTTPSNIEAAEVADVIILAVKPAIVSAVCQEIASCLTNQLILSIAAGKTIASIKRQLLTDNAVIRAMPNTPCTLSKGAVGLFAEQDVSKEDCLFVEKLFNNIAEIVWLNSEQQIDIVTALSGSGPAYYFYLTEALIKAGVELGLDENICNKLVKQTALGAAAMLNDPQAESASQLRRAVTSPNGTTEAATKVFDQHDLMNIIDKAVVAATNRGCEMSKES